MCVGNRTENQREEYVAPWSNVVDLFILPAFFQCFLVSLVSFCYCACIYFFLQLPQKVVTSYVLVFLRVMKDLPESATVAYFCLLLGLFFSLLFVFKKERIFGLPLSGCGRSTSCWGFWCSGVSRKMLKGGHVIQPNDQSLCFEGCQAALHFPMVTPRVELFCCTHPFCSAAVSLCSEEALLDSTVTLCCLQGAGFHQDCNSGALCSGNDTG